MDFSFLHISRFSAFAKSSGLTGIAGGVSHCDQSLESAGDIFRLQSNHQVNIMGEALVAMGIHRQSTDDDILDLRTIQCSGNSFDAANFHAWNER